MLVPSRRAGIGSTYNSGEDIATTPASSEVDERPNMGMLASHVSTKEREMQRHSGFITVTQKIRSHFHHLFRPEQGDLQRCIHIKESQVEIHMCSGNLIQRENPF